MKKLLIIVALLCASIFALGLVALRVAEAKFIEPVREGLQQNYALHKDALMNDLEWAKTVPLFVAERGQKDAAHFFDELIGWKHDDIELSGTLNHAFPKGDKAETFLKRDFKEALSDEEKAYLETLDLSFFKRAQAFDTWSWTKAMPLPKGTFTAFDSPIPNLFALTKAAKLRLYQGRARGDVESAIEEVEHLARLSFRAETLLGSMMGIGLMGTLETVLGDRSPYNRRDIKRARRVFWGANVVWSFMLKESERQQLLHASKGFIGRCAALGESAVLQVSIRSIAENRHPSLYRDLDAFHDEGCSGEGYRFFAQQAQKYPGAIFTLSNTSPWIRHVPFINSFAASLIITVGEPGYLREYDEPLPGETNN